MAYLWNVLREDSRRRSADNNDDGDNHDCSSFPQGVGKTSVDFPHGSHALWILSTPNLQEITGTIDDLREKGAWGALKDATLDAVDLVQDAGPSMVFFLRK